MYRQGEFDKSTGLCFALHIHRTIATILNSVLSESSRTRTHDHQHSRVSEKQTKPWPAVTIEPQLGWSRLLILLITIILLISQYGNRRKIIIPQKIFVSSGVHNR